MLAAALVKRELTSVGSTVVAEVQRLTDELDVEDLEGVVANSG